MIKTQYRRLFLILLLLCLGACFSVVNAQPKRKEFTVLLKDRYFLGENPSVAILITNTGRSPKTVKEAEHQKFSLELKGWFPDSDSDTKKLEYDGKIYYPPARTIAGSTAWFMPTIRPAKYVTLQPGESTSVHFDLQRRFGQTLDVGKYRLTVKSEKGQRVVKDLEIYFDNEKTMPILEMAMKIDYDHSDRTRAIGYLWQFNRPRFIELLNELAKSGNERQRQFAASEFFELRNGSSNHLQLRLRTKERFAINENPIVELILKSNLGTPQSVKEAQQLKYVLELRRTLPNDSKPETRTCAYAPKEPLQKPQLVTLNDYHDSTSFSLNLQECFDARLEAGDYELSVKGIDHEQLEYQIAVQKFQIVGENN
jgi:hypothetical protein